MTLCFDQTSKAEATAAIKGEREPCDQLIVWLAQGPEGAFSLRTFQGHRVFCRECWGEYYLAF